MRSRPGHCTVHARAPTGGAVARPGVDLLVHSTAVATDEVKPARRASGRRRYLPLLPRIAGLNALLLVVAVGATILILAPGRVSSVRVDGEGALVALVLVLAVALNVYLVRRIVRPVQKLTAL